MADATLTPDASAATPAETAAGTAAGGAVGQDTASVLAQAMSALASASTAISDSVNQLKNLVSDLKNASTNLDTNMEVSTVGNDDAFIGLRNERQAHNRINVLAEQALSNSIEIAKRCGHMHLDHSSALPPMAPRSASGPGTSAS